MNEVTKKYYKATDMDGTPISLIASGEKIIVTERSKADERVSSREIDHFNQRDWNGPVTNITKEEYKQILHEEWAFPKESSDVNDNSGLVSGSAEGVARSQETVGPGTAAVEGAQSEAQADDSVGSPAGDEGKPPFEGDGADAREALEAPAPEAGETIASETEEVSEEADEAPSEIEGGEEKSEPDDLAA